MSCYNHSLSLDDTTMVSKNCPIIGKHIIIFVTIANIVNIATVWPAKNTRNHSFRGL